MSPTPHHTAELKVGDSVTVALFLDAATAREANSGLRLAADNHHICGPATPLRARIRDQGLDAVGALAVFDDSVARMTKAGRVVLAKRLSRPPIRLALQAESDSGPALDDLAVLVDLLESMAEPDAEVVRAALANRPRGM